MGNNAQLAYIQKKNTFTRKPTLAQIFAYIISVCEIIVFYTIVYNRIRNNQFRISIAAIYAVAVALKILFSVIVSYIDPSDRLMIICKCSLNDGKNQQQLAKAKQKQPGHLFCRQCTAFVKKSSKHCKKCKRCVQVFDHHCIWINNCIGGLNKKPFIALLWFVQIQLTVFLVGSSFLWYQINRYSNVSQKFPIYQMAIVWAIMIIIAIFWILNINLLILHMYLLKINITNYQWLFPSKKNANKQNNMKKVIKQNDLEVNGNQAEQPNRDTGIFSIKFGKNKVFPTEQIPKSSENNFTLQNLNNINNKNQIFYRQQLLQDQQSVIDKKNQEQKVGKNESKNKIQSLDSISDQTNQKCFQKVNKNKQKTKEIQNQKVLSKDHQSILLKFPIKGQQNFMQKYNQNKSEKETINKNQSINTFGRTKSLHSFISSIYIKDISEPFKVDKNNNIQNNQNFQEFQ